MFEHEVLIQCLQRITNPMLVSVSGIKFTCSVCVPHGDQLSAASALAAAASSKVPSRMTRACSFKPALLLLCKLLYDRDGAPPSARTTNIIRNVASSALRDEVDVTVVIIAAVNNWVVLRRFVHGLRVAAALSPRRTKMIEQSSSNRTEGLLKQPPTALKVENCKSSML